MKVRELIEDLKNWDGDLDVRLASCSNDCLTVVSIYQGDKNRNQDGILWFDLEEVEE